MMLRKHHWMLHLATHLQKWGFLPSCWSLERKHKTVTKFATNMKKLGTYSLSLIEECMCHDLHALKHSEHFTEGVQLLKKHACSAKFHQFLCDNVFAMQFPKSQLWTATAAKLEAGGSIGHHDLVLIATSNEWSWTVARVEHHFQANEVIYSIVSPCKMLEYTWATHSITIADENTLHLVLTQHILCPLIYSKEGNKMKALVPWNFRPKARP